MRTKLYFIQVGVLLAGTVFSWMTALVDFMRFYENEGTLLKIKDCVYPNPVTPLCFYGAIAFAVALTVSVALLKKEGEVRFHLEKRLAMFLTAGTIFAWSNFGLLLYYFYTALPGQGVGCSGVPTSTPFATPCFYGSILFLTVLLVSLVILRTEKIN